MLRSFKALLPAAVLSVVPALAFSSGSNASLGQGGLVAAYEDPAFAAEREQEGDDVDAPQPDSWAGALAGAGRAGMMIARGARGMEYLRNTGIMGGDAYQYTRDVDGKVVRDTDFDR